MKKICNANKYRILSFLFLCGCMHSIPALASETPEWNDALESYSAYLTKDTIFWTGTEGAGVPVTDQMQFMVKDLNSDGIPELIVKNTEDIYGWIEIYTHGEFGVKEVVSCDEMGGYYPGTPVFYTRTDHVIINEDYLYLDGVPEDIIGWSLKIGQIYGYETGTEYFWCGIYSDDTADEWYDNSAISISQAEFEADLRTIIGDVQPVIITEDEWHYNTEESRREYLK